MRLRLASCLMLWLAFVVTAAQEQRPGTAVVPKTWDDAAIATLEIPLANPVGSPKHASSDYYYRIPVAPVYKNYPVYVPGREPAGYFERLTQQAPEVVWDDAGHRPRLDTEGDWIRAGELVFDAPVKSGLLMSVDDVRNPAWYAKVGWMAAADGTLPIVRYVIRQKGMVAVETLACGNCHTRLMPDGRVLKGAQGNYAIGRPNNVRLRELALSPAAAATWNQQRLSLRGTFAVPWLTPDPEARIDAMSLQEFVEMQATFPPGIIPRQRGSPLFPNQVPDLIGIKDRRYLDRTGLQTHRSIGDLMRYAAMNRGIMDGGDAFADHNGFIPGDVPRFQQLPDPSTRSRYSDDQLYALASYLYSLQPPRNPPHCGAQGCCAGWVAAERGARSPLRLPQHDASA